MKSKQRNAFAALTGRLQIWLTSLATKVSPLTQSKIENWNENKRKEKKNSKKHVEYLSIKYMNKE